MVVEPRITAIVLTPLALESNGLGHPVVGFVHLVNPGLQLSFEGLEVRKGRVQLTGYGQAIDGVTLLFYAKTWNRRYYRYYMNIATTACEVKGNKETMNGHHLILGNATDFLTGETIEDTHDERYRQKIVRFLVEQKGYAKSQIQRRQPLLVCAGECRAALWVDFMVRIKGVAGMLIHYGPGSLTTRQRSALAMSRLVEPYQIPRVVVTNGESAEILDGFSGRKIGQGLEDIPDQALLAPIVEQTPFAPLNAERVEKESRILYAFEVDGSCPCDSNIQILDPKG